LLGSAGSQSGDITVNSAISKTLGNAATLTLTAYRNVTINAAIGSTSNALGLTVTATTGAFSGTGNLTLNGGALSVTQATAGAYSGIISGTSTTVTKAGAGTITLSGNSLLSNLGSALMNKFGLQTLVKSLNENCYVGMVYGDYSLIDDKGNLLRDSSFRKYDQDQADNCIIRTFRLNNINRYLPDNFIGPFFAYRKEIMSLIGPYEELRGFEDYDYWLRINKVCEISHVPSKGDLYFYRIHHNTLTSKAKETKTYRRLIRYLKTQEFGT
jgi:hypothetical protein